MYGLLTATSMYTNIKELNMNLFDILCRNLRREINVLLQHEGYRQYYWGY